MQAGRVGIGLFVSALSLVPCSFIAIDTPPWHKPPGSTSRLFPFESNGKVGFIDSHGRIVIKAELPGPIYSVGDFSDGLARIGSLGYIDERGKWVIRGNFDRLTDFVQGRAVVSPQGRDPLVLDKHGRTTSDDPFLFPELHEGLVRFAEGPEEPYTPGQRVFVRGREGFKDSAGRVVIPAKFINVDDFSEGLAQAFPDCSQSRELRTVNLGGSCPGERFWPHGPVSGGCGVGFIDHSGDFVIPARYEAAQSFSGGLAGVQVNGLWGFINKNGTMVIAPKFTYVQPFREGRAFVVPESEVDTESSSKGGFIDTAGKMVIPPRYDFAEPFSDSLALVGINGDERRTPAYIDRFGNTKFAGIEAGSFVNGLAGMAEGNRVTYINHEGKPLFSFTTER